MGMLTPEDFAHVERTIETLKQMHLDLHRANYKLAYAFNPEATRALSSLAASTLHVLHTLEAKLDDVRTHDAAHPYGTHSLPVLAAMGSTVPSEVTSALREVTGRIEDMTRRTEATMRTLVEMTDPGPVSDG